MRFHLFPPEEDLVVAGAQRQEAADGGPTIACSILFEVVPLLAVEFEDQPIPDEEINASDSGDAHLRTQLDLQPPQPDPRQRLEPGFAARIELLDHSARTSARLAAKIGERDEAEMECRVQDGDRVVLREAPHSAPRRSRRVIDRAADRLVGPVPPNPRRRRKPSAATRSYVQLTVIDGPCPTQSQRRDAAERSA